MLFRSNAVKNMNPAAFFRIGYVSSDIRYRPSGGSKVIDAYPNLDACVATVLFVHTRNSANWKNARFKMSRITSRCLTPVLNCMYVYNARIVSSKKVATMTGGEKHAKTLFAVILPT